MWWEQRGNVIQYSKGSPIACWDWGRIWLTIHRSWMRKKTYRPSARKLNLKKERKKKTSLWKLGPWTFCLYGSAVFSKRPTLKNMVSRRSRTTLAKHPKSKLKVLGFFGFIKITNFCLKWVHMVRYWPRIISKHHLTTTNLWKAPKIL